MPNIVRWSELYEGHTKEQNLVLDILSFYTFKHEKVFPTSGLQLLKS